jgi:crossover junction endodeoxyribonuclease RuvC
MTAVVLGLDMSLTATGYAIHDGTGWGYGTINSKLKGEPRLIEIRELVRSRIDDFRPDLVLVEGYAFGRPNQAHQIGELGGVIRVMLHEHDVRWVEVPPKSVKKYASGKGNANKELMLVEAVKRLGYQGSSNDVADAMWLTALGADALGHPIVTVPAAHREALDGIAVTTLERIRS